MDYLNEYLCMEVHERKRWLILVRMKRTLRLSLGSRSKCNRISPQQPTSNNIPHPFRSTDVASCCCNRPIVNMTDS